jgi:outer membrane lipoprotein-sorting protein
MSIMRVRFVLIVLLVMWASAGVSFVADTSAGSPADAHSIVSKIIAAYGGKEAIEGIKSVYAEGTIEAFMRQDRGTYQLSFKRPRKLRVDTKYEHSSETRILNGDTGYRAMDGLPLSEAKGGSLLAMVYQYKHFDLPYGLLKGSYSITLKGQEALNGKKVEVLHLTDSEGPPMDVYVDTGTFYIVKVTGYFEMGGGRSTALSAEFSDFRKVGETVFPFRITNYAGGYRIAQTVMKIYKINPQIPDSLFTP